jgi:GxxExxY protein
MMAHVSCARSLLDMKHDHGGQSDHDLLHGELTSAIIAAFYTVYDALGHGFLESVYRNAMLFELADRGMDARKEVAIDVFVKAREVGHFRADILVDHRVIVEVKATRTIDDADRKQLLNYLRATAVEVGLLLHFGPKADFRRFAFENATKRNLADHTRRVVSSQFPR